MKKGSSYKFGLFLFLLSTLSYAQDAHYWTEQFGTKSMLLSNSVIGSVSDLGAVFYNPGRLGVIDKPAFVISAKVNQWSTTTFENATGENANISKSKFGGVPSLVSGTFKIKWLPEHKFAYAFLDRRRSDINLSSSTILAGDVIDDLPGDEYFSGSIGIGKDFSEEWIGLCWSKAFSPHISVGVSGFFSARNQNAFATTQLQAYAEDETVIMYTKKNNYNYKNYGLVWKFGLALDYEKVSLGLTLTAPTIGLKGDGSFYYEQFYSGDAVLDPIYEIDSQGGIDLTYKTPWAIGFGVGLHLFGGTLHASAEYYSKINRYTLLQAETFIGQSTGIIRNPNVINELNPVLNYGIGYNVVIAKHINAYISFSTDYSAAIRDFEVDEEGEHLNYMASTFKSDINHFAGGFVMDFPWADVTLGAANASASYDIDRPVDFPDGEGSILNADDKTKVSWSRWRFIIGISIPLIKQMADKLDLTN